MLWEASVIAGYGLAGLDGEIGSVRDFFFDDQSWVIRFLIADTGNWLTGIHISIARAALMEVDGGESLVGDREPALDRFAYLAGATAPRPG